MVSSALASYRDWEFTAGTAEIVGKVVAAGEGMHVLFVLVKSVDVGVVADVLFNADVDDFEVGNLIGGGYKDWSWAHSKSWMARLSMRTMPLLPKGRLCNLPKAADQRVSRSSDGSK
jgi:hypothetical protein